MRIALVGAPGTGKTKLARELEKVTGLPVIDGYVERLESRTNVALGFSADFVPNLGVIYERLFQEWETSKEVDGYILCGTIVESACYTSIWASNTFDLAPNFTHQRQAINALMDTIGTIHYENWNYDIVFYLPGTLKGLAERLDFSIRDALAMMRVDHVQLTDEDPINQAVEFVKERLETSRVESAATDE